MAKLTFILGGARSGKSAFAVEIARQYKRVTYVATAQVLDEEMQERVERHKKLRPSSWQVIESPTGVAGVVEGLKSSGVDLILIDCLTLYVTNLLLDDNKKDAKEDYITGEIDRLCSVSRNVDANVVMVSNEVGLGIVPPEPLGRRFQDITGRVNQIAASQADEVYFIIAGIPQRLK